MPLPHEVFDEFRAGFSATQEYPEHLVAEEFFDGLELRPGRDPEHVLAVESSIGKQNFRRSFMVAVISSTSAWIRSLTWGFWEGFLTLA